MVVKTCWILAANLVTYVLLLLDFGGFATALALYMLLGLEAALIGFNIIHDALHSSYTAHRRINRCLGYLFDLHGMSSHVWLSSHNVQHHTYTNITGFDQDIDKMIWLRLSPYDGRYWFHRYQHLYALPLYCFSSLNWSLYSDYVHLWQEWRRGRLSMNDGLSFFGMKALNLTVFLFLPMLVLHLPWWQVLIGYIALHCTGGLVSAIIFQLAHVVEGVEHPLPSSTGHMAQRWAEHEVRTTSNFATGSRWVCYLFGGLNFQIEHHLFPQVCHMLYPEIAPIVRETVREFGLPYTEQPTLWTAIATHLRHLRHLGNDPIASP